MTRFRSGILGLIAALGVAGCRGEPPSPELAPSAAEPDRLTPEESLPGTLHVFGVEVPRELRLVNDFGDRATLVGSMPFTAAVTYFSQHIEASPIEVAGERAIFTRVRFKDDARHRDVHIEISRKQDATQVQIADVTPPPVTQGLDEPARWRQAGRNPDGSPLDPKQLY